MGVESSAVQIVVNVTDANSGPVIAGVEQNIKKLGAAGASSGRQVRKGMEEAGAGALSAKEKVRLLSEEMGVRLPRAMQSMIAQSAVARNALNAVGTAMVGLGAIQIGAMVFTQLISESRKLWNNYLSLNGAQDEYLRGLEKTREEEFGNSRDIETTTARIREATEAAKGFRGIAEGINRMGWADVFSGGLQNVGLGLGQLYAAHQIAGKGVQSQTQVDRLTPEQIDQKHDLNLLKIRIDHANDEVGRRLAENQENFDRDRKMNQALAARGLANPEAPDAGKAKKALEDQLALQEAQGKTSGDAKSQAQELARIHEEALESGLRGSALYHAQEAAAIEDLKRRGIATAQAVEDVHAKYHNQEMRRLEEEDAKVRKMREETQLAGLSGVARVQQEGRNKIADVYADQNMDPGQRLAEIDAINKQTAQQIGALNNSFKDRVDEIVGQSANRELQGFARIRAEAQNQIRQLNEEYAKNGGRPEDLARGTAGINAGAQGQMTNLAEKNAQDTAQIEEQARVKFFNAEKQKTMAVQSELNERLQKYQEELNAQQISQEDYNRRVVAAEQEAQAEMVQAAREAHQKMAGEFDSLFKSLDHPLKALEGLGDKVAGNAAASLVQYIQQRSQGGAGAAGGSGVGLLDTVLGGFGGGRGGGTIPGLGAPAGAHGAHAVAQAMFAVSQATINVGGASFAGGGGTSLLAPGVAGGSGGFGGSYATSPSVYATSAGNYAAGGAGTGGGAGAPASSSVGAAPPPGNRLGSAMNGVSQGVGLFKQGASIFGGGTRQTTPAGAGGDGSIQTQGDPLAGKLNADGSFTSSGSTKGGMLGGGGIGANAGGAIGGALGMYSAVEGNGGVGGALQGAMSGMQLGMALGGPMGAAVGAAAGAIVGAIGIGGREKARVYDLKTIRPRLTADQDAFNQGSMSYSDSYQDVTGLEGQSWAVTKQMGPAAHAYWSDTIDPELKQMLGKLTAEQKAGRSTYTAQGAQYASGTDYVPSTGLALVHEGERVIPSDQNKMITSALSDGPRMPVASGSMGDIHLHLNAIDAKSGAEFLMSQMHVVRAAINQSYAENSGGGM